MNKRKIIFAFILSFIVLSFLLYLYQANYSNLAPDEPEEFTIPSIGEPTGFGESTIGVELIGSCTLGSMKKTGETNTYDIPAATTNVPMGGWGSTTNGDISTGGIDGCLGFLMIDCNGKATMGHALCSGGSGGSGGVSALLSQIPAIKECSQIIIIGGYAGLPNSVSSFNQLLQSLKANKCVKILDDTSFTFGAETQVVGSGIIRGGYYHTGTGELRVAETIGLASKTHYYKLTLPKPCNCG